MLNSLNVWTSVSACCILSGLFVLSLYAVDIGLSRDHPTTVKRRILAIGIVCLLAPCALFAYVRQLSSISVGLFVTSLGLKWNGLIAAICFPTLLIFILYAGQFFHNLIDGTALFGHVAQRKDLILRNYVIAPFAEELIFRACMLPLLQPAIGQWYAVLVCPLFFGIAHIHHLVDWYRLNDGTPFSHACFVIVIQFSYTAIFGLFSGFLFIRTGHLISLVICHSLCNIMGLPSVEYALKHPQKGVIIAGYILGAVFFFIFLFPLTSPSLYE